MKSNRLKGIVKPIIALTALILIAAGVIAVNIYYEYLQYAEIGYRYIYVFFTNITAKLGVQTLSFALVFMYFLANNFIIRKIIYTQNNDLAVVRKPFIIVVFTFILAFLASTVISDKVYQNFLIFSNASKFGETDPLFGHDIGYYVFTRPFYIAVIQSVKGILLFNIIYTFLIYVLLQLRDGIEAFKKLFENKGVFIHSMTNVMLYVVTIALSYKFAKENILYSSFGGISGAGFTHIKIWLVYYKIAPLLLIIIVPLVIYFLLKAKFIPAVVSVLIFPSVWVLTFAAACVNQSLIVDSDELAIEAPYIQNNINMTRRAYGLDKIQEKDYNISNNLTYKDISSRGRLFSNFCIADADEQLSATNKLQGLGTYYKFSDCDLVPYEIDGDKTFVAVSVRELDNDKIGKTTDTYVNKTFKYTHGTGVVVSDIRSNASDNQPEFIVKDIPVLSNVGFPKITQPRIYYGEKMNNSVVVKTGYTEVDYQNVEQNGYSYEGFGGIQMTTLNRLVLSVMNRDYQMLFSGQITSESRALINRNIIQRAKKIAPFFLYDSNPYMIITDNGDLKWVLDAYTVTDQYPYSTVAGQINYIRCPVKVVIDAFNGTVDFYIIDNDNPFVATYKNMYPTLFSQNEIPDDILSHIRYPQDMFKIQAEIYKKYHVTDAVSFYDKNDILDFAKEKNKKGENQYVESYYNLTTDENNETSCVITIPYTQAQSNDICGWLEAGSDKENYGQITAYHVNQTDENKAYGIMYAEKLIENDSTISGQISALSANGAKVSMGNMRVLPVKNSLIYISPVYVTNTENSAAYPELKRVIAIYNDKIAMEKTLFDSLQVIFGKKRANIDVQENLEEEPTLNELIDSIINMYDSIKQYNMANDWENYGKAMREFDEKMSKLKEKKKEVDEKNSFVGPPRADEHTGS
ncbi:MAG: UPF0182 family protein [Clostridia bacterium]|nr:UPF0182 family protein [Clostridia bacterium]